MHVRQATSIAAALLACSIAAPAFAQPDQMIDPDTLPPAQRAYALHGKLYDHGPTGAPASPGCFWSRIQIPTFQGLKWMAQEQCQPGNDER